MINRKHQLGVFVVILTLCVIAASPIWAQGRGPRQAASGQMTRDPLAFLKQALNKAGAAALTSDQETALNSLITNFRSANQPTSDQTTQLQAAREAYATAILAKNSGAAATAADSLAGLLAIRQRAMLEAEAGFQVQALSDLSNDQVSALVNSIGNNGVLRVLQSLIGPRPGFGRGMMGGPAMMGARPQARRPNRT